MALLAAGCSSTPRGGYYEDDGPHASPRDVSTVPDAVPRVEPRAASGNKPYTVMGKSYVPVADARGYRERGVASWYGKKFHGRRTSSGEPYDMYAMTAAHRTLPLPSYVRVRNLNNGSSVVVRVNDRGPFLHNRLIDLSYAAASRLGIVGTGTGLVEVEAISPEAPVTQVATRAPVEIISSAQAAPAARAEPVLYVQAGAFAQRDNAMALRQRLESAGLGPVFIASATAEASGARIYRVRLGPVASVEAGDRLSEQLAAQGVVDAHLIVE
jgi:rare lipoprotein A